MIVWPPHFLNTSDTSYIIVMYVIIVMHVRKCSLSTILYNEFMLCCKIIRRELCTCDKVGIEMSLLLLSPQEEHHCMGSPFVVPFLYMYVCILCVCTYMDKFTLLNSKKNSKSCTYDRVGEKLENMIF